MYRFATNACLDTLRRSRPRVAPELSGGSSRPPVASMPWLQPYPDALLDELVSDQPDPEAVAMSRESISLAYLTVIQLLAPRQRAVLILRDVLDRPASEVAALMDSSVPAVKSALQRARRRCTSTGQPQAGPDPPRRRRAPAPAGVHHGA